MHHTTDQNDQNPRSGHSVLAEISEFPVNGKRFYFKQNFLAVVSSLGHLSIKKFFRPDIPSWL